MNDYTHRIKWLVVLRFNATLIAKVISWRSLTYMFPGFLTPVLTQPFFPKPPTTFLTCFCRGERRKYAGKKVRLNRGPNSYPPRHECDTLNTEQPGWGSHRIKSSDGITQGFNPLFDDKILGLSKKRAFADDKLNVTQHIKVVFHRIENIVGKEENAGYKSSIYLGILGQAFTPIFPHFFLKLKSRTTFQILLNILNNTVISYNSFIIT